MATTGQTGDPVAAFGTWTAPRLIGLLTVAGLPADEAAAQVHRIVRREVRGGVRGGTELLRVLQEAVLRRAEPPPTTATTTTAAMARNATSAGVVAAAVGGLPWKERLATLASLGLGDESLGPGQPELVATAVDGDRSAAAEAVADAIEAAATPPDPDLIPRFERESRRRQLWAAVIAIVAVVVIAVVVFLLVRKDGGDGAGAAAPNQITQWVAVLDVGPDAFSLYPEVREVGRIAGVYVFTDRWDCYDGFPSRQVSDEDDWFLGLAAQEKSVVDDLLQRLGRTPSVEARVHQTCLLPAPADLPSFTVPIDTPTTAIP